MGQVALIVCWFHFLHRHRRFIRTHTGQNSANTVPLYFLINFPVRDAVFSLKFHFKLWRRIVVPEYAMTSSSCTAPTFFIIQPADFKSQMAKRWIASKEPESLRFRPPNNYIKSRLKAPSLLFSTRVVRSCVGAE